MYYDSGKEFTDRLFASRQREPSGMHEFDQLCQALGIGHRLTRPRTPQTNGMVKRFNGRMADILKTHRFSSRQRHGRWESPKGLYFEEAPLEAALDSGPDRFHQQSTSASSVPPSARAELRDIGITSIHRFLARQSSSHENMYQHISIYWYYSGRTS